LTYSIVARDPRTGALGVAVQSHCFAVGSLASWAEAGAGAVATQSVVERGGRGTRKRAHDRVDAADELAAASDMEAALEQYAAAHRARPDNPELAFWHGVALVATGREQEAPGLLEQAFRAGDGWRELLEQAFRAGHGWRELLRRLPAAGLLPNDDELISRLAR